VGKPKCSSEIESPSDALEYVRERMVGDHTIVLGEKKVTIRFASEENHYFTVSIKKGRTPPPDLVITRHKSKEKRLFSRQRAKLIDQILPTLERAAGAVAAKMSKGTLVYGPADASGRLMAVIVYIDADS